MSQAYKILKLSSRCTEAATELQWFAQAGYYKIRVVGYGANKTEAVKSAELMLGQARAALHVATINSVPHRVPETPTENAHDRNHRPQHAD